MNVGVRELRLRLSRYLDQVRQGQIVIVTDHGTPIAQLARVDSPKPPEMVTQLVNTGLLVYRVPPRHLPEPIPLLPGKKTLVEYVADQRR